MFATIYERAVKALPAGKRDLLIDLSTLAGVLWVAHFWLFRSFGLYEDDYSHISPALGWHLVDLVHSLRVFVNWPLGRPLGYFLNFSLAFLGGKLGGLSTIYVLNYLIQVANALLFYFLLTRIGHKRIAWIGAVIFGLFPAITTHIYLMHAVGEEYTSLMFILIASHCYLSGRKALAHLLSVACLLSYETPYAVFLAVPLLVLPWDKKLFREMLRHAAIWLGIFLAVMAIRVLIGEGRIAGATSSAATAVGISRDILASLYIGPPVALSTLVSAPAWTISHWEGKLTLLLLVCLPIFAFMLRGLGSASPAQGSSGSLHLGIGPLASMGARGFEVPCPQTLKLMLTALVLLSVAYLLTFYQFPPIATYGRESRVHLAATFGGALLFAAVCALFLAFLRSHHLGYVGVLGLALYLSLLVGYRFLIQEDFKAAWQNEKEFWSGVVYQVPDLTDGTVILVWDHGLPQNRFILANSWADPLVLPQVFQFPAEWQAPPRVWVVSDAWLGTLDWSGGQLSWQVPAATWPAHRAVLPQGNTVLLEYENGRLVRRQGVFAAGGHTLQLKTRIRHAKTHWPKGALYPLLISTMN